MNNGEKLRYIRDQLNLSNDILAVNAGTWGPLCKATFNAIKLTIKRKYEYGI